MVVSVVASAPFKYPGFISYSHRDKAVADRLHRAIERYRVPARLAGTAGAHGPVPKRLYPIFRDRDELAAGSLGPQLHEAIAQSRCFVLICSPAAAASRWVNEEVAHFLKVGDPARLLCLIADGQPNAADPSRECFPPVLREAGLEPMAAELHDDADGEANARLKIIAGLLGVGFEGLRRRDLAARNQRLVAIAAMSLAVAAMTAVLAYQAVKARDEAERSRQQGEELIGFMLGDLRGRLEPLGKLDILDAVGDQAMDYFAGLDGGRDPGPRALGARAKALRQIGEVRFAQGRPADAIESLAAALSLQRTLVDADPSDNALLFELGQIEYWVGYAAWRAGDYDRAERNFSAYREVSERLVARDTGNRDWQAEVAYASNNLGVLAFERRRYAEALDGFDRGLTAAQPLLDDPDIDPHLAASLANMLSWKASALLKLGRTADGMTAHEAYRAQLMALVDRATGDQRLRHLLASSLSTYGFDAIESGNPKLALRVAAEGLALARPLISADPANLDYQLDQAYLVQVEASAHYQLGQWDRARAGIDEAQRQLKAVIERDPSVILARVSMLAAWDIGWSLHWRRGDRDGLRQQANEALALAASTPEGSPHTGMIRATAALMALEVAIHVDHDAAAAARHRQVAQSALDAGPASGDDASRRAARLRALLALMSGANAIDADALPDTSAPWAQTVIDFIERRCHQPGQSAQSGGSDCQTLSPIAADARQRWRVADGSGP